LTQGWDGWKEYRLTDALVNKFFAGQSKEAERVADVLFRLANATDKTNIFVSRAAFLRTPLGSVTQCVCVCARASLTGGSSTSLVHRPID
jgi:hypothetical protein